MNELAISVFKKIRESFFFLLAGLCCCEAAEAQQHKRYIVYDVKNGLSQNSVHAIMRDKHGLVWIGTQDGLNSFDGVNFTAYTHIAEDSTSISDQFILSIKEDATGNLWVGTRNGLNYFNRRTKKFKRVYLDKSEQHAFQSEYDKFYVQEDNRIVIKKEGLHLLDPSNGKILLLQADDGDVADWLVLPNYNAWRFTKSRGILFYPDIRRPATFQHAARNASLPDITHYYFSLALNDSIYCLYNFAVSNTIHFFNTKSGNIEGKLLCPGRATALAASQRQLTLCTTTGLYAKPADMQNTWVQSSSILDDGLPPGGFLTAYFDAGENTWLGTAGSGLAVHNPRFNNFTTIPTPIPNDRITGITFSGPDLFLTSHTGLYSIKNFTNSPRQSFTSIIRNTNISSIRSNRDGTMWLAVNNENLQLVNKTGNIIRQIKLPERAYKSNILNLLVDDRDRLWVTTSYGVYIVDATDKRQTVKVDTSLNQHLLSNYYMSAYQDREGNVWLAGNLGLDMVKPSLNAVRSFPSNTDTQSFLKRTIITSVTQDMDGAIWIASIRNGVYKLQHNRYTHYTQASGLSSDIAYNLMCDNSNRIWVTTSSGLNIFDRSENGFKPIAAFDGVPKNSFTFGSVLKHNGQLIIGGTGSLLVCLADNYVFKKEKLNAFISDVTINGQSIPLANNEFSLMPDNKIIRFEFAYSPAFYAGNVLYQYRLKGADTTWINLSNGTNAISYTGLPYKKLYMEVRAASSKTNLGNAAVFSLQINSKAPFYKTLLFFITIAALFIFLISMLVIYANKRKFKKQLAALQMEKELHKERFRIGRDLHDNIGAYTSALIAGLNRIQSTASADLENIADLKDYGANIMGLLRETIWMLNAAELTVTAFTDRFINYAMRINKNYPHLDCSFVEEIENDKKLQPTIMLNLFRILQEALQNACKHANASSIRFTVRSGQA
ncbi:MAG: hypothetical protein EOP51_14120, partial [Sphingobacteriales bacterium]